MADPNAGIGTLIYVLVRGTATLLFYLALAPFKILWDTLRK